MMVKLIISDRQRLIDEESNLSYSKIQMPASIHKTVAQCWGYLLGLFKYAMDRSPIQTWRAGDEEENIRFFK